MSFGCFLFLSQCGGYLSSSLYYSPYLPSSLPPLPEPFLSPSSLYYFLTPTSKSSSCPALNPYLPLPSLPSPSPPVGVSQVIELEKLLAAGGTPDDIRARIEKTSEAVPEAVVEVQEKEKEAAKVEVEKVEEVVTPPVETPIVEALPVSVPV